MDRIMKKTVQIQINVFHGIILRLNQSGIVVKLVSAY